MLFNLKEPKIITCLEINIDHPFKEIDKYPMFITKFLHSGSYLFSIPKFNWTYEKREGEEINIQVSPSSYHYEKYKPLLINAMNKAIALIEDKKCPPSSSTTLEAIFYSYSGPLT